MQNATVISSSNGYRTIKLVDRYSIMSLISKDVFYDKISADFKAAISTYNDLVEPEIDKKIEEYLERAKEEAAKKYKRKSSIEKYVNDFKETLPALREMLEKSYKMTYIDFDPSQGSSYHISRDCIIDNDAINNKETIYRCFDELVKHEWFKTSYGWEIVYECPENSYRNAFRPQIILKLPEDCKQELEKKKNELYNDISSFYSGSNYCGD